MINRLLQYSHPSFRDIKQYYLFAFMLLLGVFGAKAQHYEFKHLGSIDGLIGNSVYSTVEDTSGFVWFATNRTVCRYDGNQFTYFGKEEGYTEDGAYFIYKDKNAMIWVISFNFKLFYFNGSRFIEFTAIPNASWLCEDDGGLMYVLTRDRIIQVVQGLKVIKSAQIFPELPQNQMFNLVALSAKKWLLSGNNAIYVSDGSSAKQLLAESCSLYVSPARLYKLTNGSVLISICSNLYIFNAETQKVTLFYSEENLTTVSFFEDTENNDIFITSNHGVLKFEGGNLFAKPIHILEDKIIDAIGKSKEGIYWFCSNAQGIFYGNFSSCHITPKDGLPADVRFIRASKKGIFYASLKGTVGTLTNNGKYLIPKLLVPSSFTYIQKAVKLPNGEVHFSSAGFNPVLYKGLSKKYIDNNRMYIFNDNQDVLFYFRKDTGAFCYSTQTHQIIANKPISPNISLKHDWDIENPNTVLGDSIFVFIQKTGYTTATLRGNSIYYKKYKMPGLSLAQVIPSPSGNLIFSTQTKGIVIKTGNTTQHITTSDGLISNYCNNIYYENNQLWVCTELGLSRVKLSATDKVLSIQNYNSDDYLLTNNVRDIAIADSLLYVVTDNGISIFNPDKLINKKYVPSIYIKQVTINGNKVNQQQHFTLPYSQSNLSIYYQAISMRKATPVGYRYRLTNIDTGYTYTKENNVNYAKLPPGQYQFIVYATNGNGKWSKYPATISFTITAPYWQTLWFKALVLALILGITFVIVKRRDTLSRRKQESKKRLIESELKALRLQMNPHFIFNTLNSLQKFILQYKPIEANKYIAKFSRLMRWIMIYSDKQQISLQEELDFLNLYIELEQLRFKNAFTTHIEIDETLNTQEAFIPSLIIQPFVENAIKYGLTEKPKAEQGALSLLIKTSGDLLYVTITDNGVGRDLIKKRQQTEVSKPASTGIKSTTERLLILHDNRIKNPVVITDLFDKNKQACGTKVELIIPLKYG